MKDILQSRNSTEMARNVAIFTAFVVILTFFMRYLWNSTLVKYITVLRPVDSLMSTFLLSLGIALFRL
jgi:hypothetical protein